MTIEDYHKKALHLGFSNFPIKERGEVIGAVQYKNYPIVDYSFVHDVDICIREVTFGDKEEHSCWAIVTNDVTISSRLWAGGFGKHSYIEESKTMRNAVTEYVEALGLKMCRLVRDWPSTKIIVESWHDSEGKPFLPDEPVDQVKILLSKEMAKSHATSAYKEFLGKKIKRIELSQEEKDARALKKREAFIKEITSRTEQYIKERNLKRA